LILSPALSPKELIPRLLQLAMVSPNQPLDHPHEKPPLVASPTGRSQNFAFFSS
jgi:hypothetical protein